VRLRARPTEIADKVVEEVKERQQVETEVGVVTRLGKDNKDMVINCS
jgi:hypothetical protein